LYAWLLMQTTDWIKTPIHYGIFCVVPSGGRITLKTMLVCFKNCTTVVVTVCIGL